MTGCTIIELTVKLGFIPNGILSDSISRLRGCIRKELKSKGHFPEINNNSTHEEMLKYCEDWNIVGKAFIYPLTK